MRVRFHVVAERERDGDLVREVYGYEPIGRDLSVCENCWVLKMAKEGKLMCAEIDVRGQRKRCGEQSASCLGRGLFIAA